MSTSLEPPNTNSKASMKRKSLVECHHGDERIESYRERMDEERRPRTKAMMFQHVLFVRLLVEMPTQRTQMFADLQVDRHLKVQKDTKRVGIVFGTGEYKTGHTYGRMPTVVPSELGMMILRWVEWRKEYTSSPYLFVTFTTDEARPRFERWTRKVLNADITPMDIRHICASHLAEVGTTEEMRKIAKAFRHSYDVAKQHYIEVSDWKEQEETIKLYQDLRGRLISKGSEAEESGDDVDGEEEDVEEAPEEAEDSDSEIESEMRKDRVSKEEMVHGFYQELKPPTPTQRRKREPWMPEEDAELEKGIEERGRGRWKMILEKSPTLKRKRTAKDLHDRYRILKTRK